MTTMSRMFFAIDDPQLSLNHSELGHLRNTAGVLGLSRARARARGRQVFVKIHVRLGFAPA